MRSPADTAAPTEDDVVRLTVPAALEYVRIVRLAGSAVASRLGFDVEEIENLRVALDELASIAIDAASGEIDLEFSTTETELHISGRAALRPGADAPLDALTAQILKAVIDDYELEAADGNVRFWCVIRRPI